MQLVKKIDFAKILNISPAYVTKLIKNNRLVIVNELIDLEKSKQKIIETKKKREYIVSDSQKLKISETMKKRYSDGVHQINNENLLNAGKLRSNKLKGTMVLKGKGARDENNIHAKCWVLKTPSQKIIKTINLNKFVRDNSNLFDEKDVIWNKSSCNAVKGLRSLFYMKKDGSSASVNSWKGWMIGDKFNPT